jgi:hypothetical protein
VDAPPDFRDRIAALTGRTAYRVPVGGRATGTPMTDQDVAAAVAMGRRRFRSGEVDPRDVGPEVLYGICTGTRHRKPDVCQRIAEMILAHVSGKQRFRVYKAVNAAYEDVVMAVTLAMPEDIPRPTWETLFATAVGILRTESEGALRRAERAFFAETA